MTVVIDHILFTCTVFRINIVDARSITIAEKDSRKIVIAAMIDPAAAFSGIACPLNFYQETIALPADYGRTATTSPDTQIIFGLNARTFFS